MDMKNQIFKHSFIYLISKLVSRSLTFFLIPVYTAYLTPDKWGIVSLLFICLDLFMLITSCQLSQSMYRFYALSDTVEEKKKIIGVAFVYSILISTIVAIPIYLFPDILGRIIGVTGYNSSICLVFLTGQFAIVMTLIQVEIRLHNEAKLYGILEVIINFGNSILKIFFVVFIGWGIKGMIIGQFIVFFILVLFFLPRTIRRISLTTDFQLLKKLLAFSMPLIPSAIAMASVHVIDRFFIQHFLGQTDLGIYSIGYRFGTIINILILSPFVLVWEPKSYEISKTKDASIVYGNIFTYLAYLVVFTAVGLSVTSKEIVQVLAADEYLNAFTIIPLISWSYAIFALDHITKIGLLVNHKTKTLAAIIFLICIINLIGNYIFIPLMGMYGAAFSTFCSFVILFVLDFMLSKKYLKIKIEWNKIIPLLLCASIFYGVLSSITGFNLVESILYKFLIMLLFLFCLFSLLFYDKKKNLISFFKTNLHFMF